MKLITEPPTGEHSFVRGLEPYGWIVPLLVGEVSSDGGTMCLELKGTKNPNRTISRDSKSPRGSFAAHMFVLDDRLVTKTLGSFTPALGVPQTVPLPLKARWLEAGDRSGPPSERQQRRP